MKPLKIVLTIHLFLNVLNVHSQDTIYSDAYPKGIVVPTVDITNYKTKQNPIENPTLELIIPKKQIIKITNSSGVKFENNEYIKTNDVVVPIEQSTGKVNYIGIIEIEGAKKQTLFKALKTLPSANIQYTLISSDETDNTFIQYSGKFNTRFAGDLYDVVFNLTIKFKDGKIKYNYHDFMFCFEEIKQKTRGDFGGTYSINTKYKNANPLEKFYVPGYRGDKFWETISNNMDESIKTINKIGKEFSSDKDGF